MKRASVLLVVFACVLALNAQKKDKNKAASGDKASSANADLWVGTWKLNPAKSKLLEPAQGDVTIKIDAADANSVKYTVTEKDASGNEHTETYDGKPGVESALTRDGQEEGRSLTTGFLLAIPHRRKLWATEAPRPKTSRWILMARALL